MNPLRLVSRINQLRGNLFYDLRYGRFLGGTKKTPFAHLGANDTANSLYEALPYLFKDIVHPSDVLVDVGCGRGRVLNWWLDHYPGHRIFGIELDPEVAAEAAARLAGYRVTILAGDARALVPEEGTLYYLYNPFKAEVMADFLNVLKRRACGRTLRVIYYNTLCLRVFEDDPHCGVTPIPMPTRFHTAALIEICPR